MGAMKTALDVALFSLRKVVPVISKVWANTRDYIGNTKARPLVCNPIVRTTETALDAMHEKLINKCVEFRARLLPKELENLEKEVERLKKEIEDGKKSISKNLKPVVSTVWNYAKVEMIPPMTSHIFQGPIGKKFENTASSAADSLIRGLEQSLKDIENERIRVIKAREAAIKAAAERAKALKKAEEQKRIQAEKVAAEAKAKKAKEEATASEATKAQATAVKPETKSKDKPKRVQSKTKKRARRTRRRVKRGLKPKRTKK